jgi:transposase InsO family protein
LPTLDRPVEVEPDDGAAEHTAVALAPDTDRVDVRLARIGQRVAARVGRAAYQFRSTPSFDRIAVQPGTRTMACGHRKPVAGALHHTDRGSQDASEAFQRALRKRGLAGSMSRRGDCYDNPVVESYFGTLKTELIHRRRWPTRRSARSAIHDYIEIFYNRRRLHSHLGYVSPVEFEANLIAASAA